ncbi:MAG: glyoxalase [Bdellovibrionaceae bacterium]|nr:glyoxalase [Pseudobdellovibrionaceae bacterium]
MNSLFILYVQNQDKSKEFYQYVLGKTPTLHVPGMTEFSLGSKSGLGLMPEKGIKRIIGDPLPTPVKGHGIPRSELYLYVEDLNAFHKRALELGAIKLNPLEKRNWDDEVAYSMDLVGHVLAFAKRCGNEK